jgi:hypothetical protein
MNIESQICTLEQAKRLDWLSNGEKSYFYWAKEPDEKWGVFCCENLPYIEEPKLHAYTSAELGEIINSICTYVTHIREDNLHIYTIAGRATGAKEYLDIPEAHARAEFLIYLLENRND